MGTTWRLGSLFGIPIEIDLSGAFVAGVIALTLATGAFPSQFPGFGPAIYLAMGLCAAVLLFASVIAHELSHCLVAKHDGLGVEGITFFAFGGIARLSEEPRTAREELRMASAGPLCSLGIGFVLVAVVLLSSGAWLRSPAMALIAYVAAINVALGLFNLLPGFPLDGGRILRAILWGTTRDLKRATWASAALGQAVALLLAFWGVFRLYGAALGDAPSGFWLSGFFLILTGVFLFEAARRSYRAVAQLQVVPVPVEDGERP